MSRRSAPPRDAKLRPARRADIGDTERRLAEVGKNAVILGGCVDKRPRNVACDDGVEVRTRQARSSGEPVLNGATTAYHDGEAIRRVTV